jgi:uncharacterized membrane protein
MGDQRKKLSRQRRRAVERSLLERSERDPPPQRIQEVSLQWRYHLPPPGLLQEYSFIKNGPDRLLRMAEQQARHRRKIENRDSWTEAFQRVFGSISGFLIGAGGISAGTFLIHSGNDVTGFITLISTLGVLITALQSARAGKIRGQNEPPPPEQRELFDQSG